MVKALYGAWNVMTARETPRDSGSEPTLAAPLSSGSVVEAATLAAPCAKFDSTGPTIDLDVVAQRRHAGRAVQETRLSTDTDREDMAASAAARHAARRAENRELLAVPMPKSRSFGPGTARRSPVGAIALGVTATAILAGIAWYLLSPPADPNGGPSAPTFGSEAEAEWYNQQVAPLLAIHEYVRALKRNRKAPPEFREAAAGWR